jgi:nucleotide-binding universal stress UspA family protein
MTRFNRIVCPVDWSEYSRRALDHAVAIARWHGSRVSALHVYQIPAPAFIPEPAPGAVPLPAAEPVQAIGFSEAERARLEVSLRDWVKAAAMPGVSVETAVAEGFNVSTAILSHAAALGADLLVVATHGRSGFKRFVLGSVTEKLLRTSDCPVLVVPPDAPDAAASRPVNYQRIVCAVDFSKATRPSLDIAASLAAEAGGRVTVAHVVEMPHEIPDTAMPDLRDQRAVRFQHARRQLKTLTAPLRQSCGIDDMLLAGTPAHEILRLADEQQADLIVMGRQGRGAVERMLHGSVTQHVTRRATCPVLTVHGAE